MVKERTKRNKKVQLEVGSEQQCPVKAEYIHCSCHSPGTVVQVQVTLRVEVPQLEEDSPVLYWTPHQN